MRAEKEEKSRGMRHKGYIFRLTFSSRAGPFSIACITASEMRLSRCLTAFSTFRAKGSLCPSTATTSRSTVSTYSDQAKSSSEAGSVKQPLRQAHFFRDLRLGVYFMGNCLLHHVGYDITLLVTLLCGHPYLCHTKISSILVAN